MDTVAEMIPSVLQFFNFRTVIGVGVGAGAYVLSKFTNVCECESEENERGGVVTPVDKTTIAHCSGNVPAAERLIRRR
ncbi:putative protein NDRG2 [Scophthalmus maximus]|uniref:Uncharacterized protein n=1 Tax=Scophthalmus maximus TaxID=52904 RepID=A0A2U9AZS8_SCOMX|nr:putative protein NDRG2 [Scophthalmus maximus]